MVHYLRRKIGLIHSLLTTIMQIKTATTIPITIPMISDKFDPFELMLDVLFCEVDTVLVNVVVGEEVEEFCDVGETDVVIADGVVTFN